MTQLEWVLERFDELFADRASGELPGYQLRAAPIRPWYMLQIAGESSFFHDAEIPPAYRRRILERLTAFQDDRQVNLHVMIETRPEHLASAAETGELDRLRPLLNSLDVVINTGYEFADEFLRNVVFAKDLDEADFEKAIRLAGDYGLDPGVFVFAGGYVLTASEVLAETRRTLARLEGMGVFANVMVPNLQSFTIPDLLWEFGHHELPEPYILLDLAEMLLAYSPRRPRRLTPFDWFLGGLVADPPPRVTVLSNPRRRTSDRVTDEILACLDDLVRSLNGTRFRRYAALLRKEADYRWYRAQLEERDLRPWSDRVLEAGRVAEELVEEYDARISRAIAA